MPVIQTSRLPSSSSGSLHNAEQRFLPSLQLQSGFATEPFEEALRAQGMNMALAILEKMRKEEKKTRSVAPARRVSGRKMTPELARKILELHSTTDMTQQEIAFQLGINQGRVNEVIKRGK